MKTTNAEKPVFQGDLMVIRVNELPKNAVEVKDNVVAHSETGHHHVVERARVFRVLGDTMRSYLRPRGDDGIDLIHLRPFDTHETLRLLDDGDPIYEVRRQREWVPEGMRAVRD